MARTKSPGRVKPVWGPIILGLLGVVAVIAFSGWYRLFHVEPQAFTSVEEAFKYRSIGTEEAEGLPYLIWRVLPDVFPEYLPGPGGYASFGYIFEEGRDTPVGFSKKTIGFPRVGITCGVCHTGTYRTAPDQPTVIVPTAPAHSLDVQGYLRFLNASASDPRFTPEVILAAIESKVALDPVDKALYRFLIIPRTREALLAQKQQTAWTESRPDWGRGRIDPFNPVKFHQLGLDPAKDDTIGNSDMEPLWNLARHEGFALHWDGLDDNLTEVVLTGAIGDGATRDSLPVDDLLEIEAWLKTTPPPRYPFPIDPTLAAKGEPIFHQHCASCHAFGGERTGHVIPLAEIGTDRHRLDMWTQEAADRYNDYAPDKPWDFDRLVKTDGYVAVALDGLWLRAPYLHNGSVPTLEDLLEPAERRPKVFYRGYDVYDRERTGFISQGPEAERSGFRYDTSVAANGNGGHEGDRYGTSLSAEDKRALIEFLKTQ